MLQGLDRPVVVLDFGAQYSKLIARRVRELNVYAELLPFDTPLEELERRQVKGVILSGGPKSVYDEGAPRPDPAIWSGRIPVLGICYGAQLMALELGGDVMASDHREYGPASITITDETDKLLTDLGSEQPVWMSHGDSITRLPTGFVSTAQTDSTPYAGLADHARRLYGIQFHPEVVHTPRGKDVLANFVHGIAGAESNWTSANFIESTVERIRERVDKHAAATGEDGKVICGLSGGVDSSVAAALVHLAVGDRLGLQCYGRSHSWVIDHFIWPVKLGVDGPGNGSPVHSRIPPAVELGRAMAGLLPCAQPAHGCRGFTHVDVQPSQAKAHRLQATVPPGVGH